MSDQDLAMAVEGAYQALQSAIEKVFPPCRAAQALEFKRPVCGRRVSLAWASYWLERAAATRGKSRALALGRMCAALRRSKSTLADLAAAFTNVNCGAKLIGERAVSRRAPAFMADRVAADRASGKYRYGARRVFV